MKRLPLVLFLAALLASCGDDSSVAGTDEHGNALAARVLVRDSSGAPATGVEVVFRPSAWLDGERLDSASFAGSRCTTDSDGICPIDPGGVDSSLTVRAGDGERAAAATVSRATRSDVVLRLASTGSVQGILKGAGAGVRVRVPGLPGTAWTDDSGRFSLGSLPEGRRRLVVGSASLLVVDSVPVRSRRVLDFQVPMPASTSHRTIVLDTFALHVLPPTPVFSPPGGTYSSVLDIVFPGLSAGDAVETSEDGIRWEVLNGSVRLMASACIAARTVRDGRIVSNVSRACYVLAP